MPRLRKDRLIPSITTYNEELIRTISASIKREVALGTEAVRRGLLELQREIGRLGGVLTAKKSAPRGRGGRPRSHKTCTVRGCGLPHVARGLCKNHYQAARYAEKMAAGGKTVVRRVRGPEPTFEGAGRKVGRVVVAAKTKASVAARRKTKRAGR